MIRLLTDDLALVRAQRDDQARGRREAEAKLAKLTAERDRQRGAAEKYYAESERLRAEIERLKEGGGMSEPTYAREGRMLGEALVEVKLQHEAGLVHLKRAEQAEAALRKIESISWDSGSTPAPEVVSRIYCVAVAALYAGPKEEHRRHPTGDYCIFCRAQWPCEESEGE